MRTNIRKITAASVLPNVIVILSFIGLPELPGAVQCSGSSQATTSAPRNL